MATATDRSETAVRECDGEPYHVTRNYPLGYGVCPAGNPIERIGRTYLVQINEVGAPFRCSCPSQHHRGGTCKHMTAVKEVIRETALAGLTEIGKRAVAINHPSVPFLRWVYRRINSGATPRPLLQRILPRASGAYIDQLNELIGRC